MRVGKAITVAPVDQLLTTQEAANFLGISRPTLVRLLEEGALPYERTTGGRHDASGSKTSCPISSGSAGSGVPR
ncbi:excisionase family DNA-binding protein [Corynebacterium diphtheriae]